MADIEESWRTLHDEAVADGRSMYKDPGSGFMVFTEQAHLKRGKCCGSGCRHCPFAHERVPLEKRLSVIKQPAFLHRRGTAAGGSGQRSAQKALFILSWSGGKDSFLTLRELIRLQLLRGQQEEGGGNDDGNLASSTTSLEAVLDNICLLTSFDAKTRIIAHQEISIEDIVKQARYLDLDLIGVPLHGASNESYLQRMEKAVQVASSELKLEVNALVFGDLHLQVIVDWRKATMTGLARELLFPLFKSEAGSNYPELLEDLAASTVPCFVCACPSGQIDISSEFNAELADRVQKEYGWDPFGENGEFHTIAQVWNAKDAVTALTKK